MVFKVTRLSFNISFSLSLNISNFIQCNKSITKNNDSE